MSTAASAPPLSTSAALPKTTGKLLLPVFGLLGSAFGAGVGVAVGFTVGVAVGTAVGLAEGVAVGFTVGVAVGAAVGFAEGAAVGVSVGAAVGFAEGAAVGVSVGASVGLVEGAAVGVAVGVSVVAGFFTNAAIASSMAFAIASTSSCSVMFLSRTTALIADSTAVKSVYASLFSAFAFAMASSTFV